MYTLSERVNKLYRTAKRIGVNDVTQHKQQQLSILFNRAMRCFACIISTTIL